MFEVRNISKLYKTKEGVMVNALTNVNIDFGDKGLVFLLGKSGSGKSTLLNILGGLDTPTSGEIIINRRSSETFSGSDFDNYRNTYVGIIFQEYNLIENYTVGANIGLALELQGKKADKIQIDEVLRKVGLADSSGATLYSRRVNELSGGQKQRVAVARALIKDPEIILADEPTGALDNKTGESLYELFKELSKEKLVIVVTHDRESASRYGDKIIELVDGEVLTNREIATRERDIDKGKDCNFIKSRISFKRSFTLGISGLKTKPLRLISTILLSVIAFCIFSISLLATSISIYRAEIQIMYDNDQHMVAITNIDNYDAIIEYNNNIEPMRIYEESAFMDYEIFYDNPYSKYLQFSNSSLYVELDSDHGEEYANLTPDSRFINKELCRLPRAANEVAITDYYADRFIALGYSLNGRRIKINTPDDLIGKKYGGLIICGVYSTEINLDLYREYNAVFTNDDSYIHNMTEGIASSILSYKFVSKDYGKVNNKISTGYLLKLSGDIDKDIELIKKASLTRNPKLHSAYSESVKFLNTFDKYVIGPANILAVVFCFISILLMFNYVSMSISSKKQELGILRSLGATKLNVLLICVVESLIVSVIICAISIGVSIMLCYGFNMISGIKIFSFGIINALFISCLSGITMIISTVIPLAMMVNKKPIDIINNR